MQGYRDKREIRRTPESRGDGNRLERFEGGDNPMYVLQARRAGSRPLEFRLETEGVRREPPRG